MIIIASFLYMSLKGTPFLKLKISLSDIKETNHRLYCVILSTNRILMLVYSSKPFNDGNHYNGCGALCAVCLALLLAGFTFSLAVTEAVYLKQNTEAKHECGPAIWYCILACCIAHFLSLVSMLIGSIVDEKHRSKTNAFSLVTLGIAIWVMICYYDTEQTCANLFQNVYPNLWLMLTIEVVVFYILCGLIGLLLLLLALKLVFCGCD